MCTLRSLNLTLVYTFPMCMAWSFHFPICNYDFKAGVHYQLLLYMGKSPDLQQKLANVRQA